MEKKRICLVLAMAIILGFGVFVVGLQNEEVFSFIENNLNSKIMMGRSLFSMNENSDILIETIESKWNIIKSEGNEDNFKVILTDLKDKKTDICFVLKDGVSPANVDLTDKVIYDSNGNQILDDKAKSMIIKYETSKCNDGGVIKDGYHLSLTDAQAINIDDSIKIGENSLILVYEEEKRIKFTTSQNQEIGAVLYWDVYRDGSDWSNSVNNISIISNEGSYKFQAIHNGNEGIERYKYIITSNEKPYRIGEKIIWKSCVDDYYGLGSTCNVTQIDLQDILYRDFETNYSITDYQIGEDYFVEVIFLSDKNIDPDIVAGDFTGCGDIVTEGYYNLTASISSPGVSCITINSSNVFLEGNGFTLTGTDVTSTEGVQVTGLAGSELTNVTVNNIKTMNYNIGIGFLRADNSTLSNSQADSARLRGTYISTIINMTVLNHKASDSDGSGDPGLALSVVTNSLVRNYVSINNYWGVLLINGEASNEFTNMSITGSTLAFRMDGNQDFNIITNSTFTNNTMQLFADSTGADNNWFYNNFFNTSGNSDIIAGANNYFNTSLTAGTNIIGGSFIGGNYWGLSDGTGYSDTCTEGATAGICESPANITDSKICVGCTDYVADLLPLTYSGEPPPTDDTYPTFWSFTEEPTDSPSYSPNALYNFNTTLNNTNGSIGLEFNEVNYTASNESINNIFNVSIKNLEAGVYNYYWWGYGNGTSENYNSTQVLTYTVTQNNTYLLGLTATTPITYGTATNFAGSGCPTQLSCGLNISNIVYGVGIVSANYSTVGNINYSANSKTFSVTINQATPITELYIGGARSNKQIDLSETVLIEGQLDLGQFGTLNLTINGDEVNSTETLSSIKYTFDPTGLGVFYVGLNYSGNENYTSAYDNYNITVVHIGVPVVLITYPIAMEKYTLSSIDLNYTLDESFEEDCWYSKDLGVTNSSTVLANTNFTGITTVEGENTWRVYCNDSSNNVGYDSISFYVDTIKPKVNIVYPTNTTYTSVVTELNYTVSDTNLQSCWYSLNLGVDNVTIANCGENVTGLNSGSGSSTWFIYSNDSYGNTNSSNITFSVEITDAEYPIFSNFIEFPTDSANYVLNQKYFFNTTVNNTNGTIGIEFDGVNYTSTNLSKVFNATILNLGAGTYNYYWFGWGNGTDENYNSTQVYTYTVDKATPSGTITGTTPINYGTAGDVEGTESNTGDGDLVYVLVRDDVPVSNPDTTVLGVATYEYVYNTSGGQNYTAGASLDTFSLTVNQLTGVVSTFINGVQASQSFDNNTQINLTGVLDTGVGDINLSVDGVQREFGTSPLQNITIFVVGTYIITTNYSGNENYTQVEETWTLTINEPISEPISEPLDVFVIFNRSEGSSNKIFDVDELGDVTTVGYFKGLFDWVIGASSNKYLHFDGKTLNFNDSQLNITIDNRVAWNVSGNNLYTDDLDYNLGLGTETPTHKLNVVGSFNATVDGWFGDDLFVGDDLGVGTDNPQSELHIADTSFGGNVGLRLQNSEGWNEIQSDAGGLKFYINSSTTKYSFDMTKDGEVNFRNPENTSQYFYLFGGATNVIRSYGSDFKIMTRQSEDIIFGNWTKEHARFNGDTSFLGLGTATPKEKLHLNGNLFMDNNVNPAGAFEQNSSKLIFPSVSYFVSPVPENWSIFSEGTLLVNLLNFELGGVTKGTWSTAGFCPGCTNGQDAGAVLDVRGEATISGINSDGTGKLVCIKADKNVGTCSDDPTSGSGTCTCS